MAKDEQKVPADLQETAVGLPNTCAGCAATPGATWWAQNDDQARAGQGFCPTCAGKVPEAPKPTVPPVKK